MLVLGGKFTHNIHMQFWQRKRNRIIVVSAILLVICGFAGWRLWLQSSEPTSSSSTTQNPVSVQHFDGFSGGKGIPSKVGLHTSVTGIYVAWEDNRVVDGNYVCLIYNADSKVIIGRHVVTSGMNSEGKVSQSTDYLSDELPRATIDQLVTNYCATR